MNPHRLYFIDIVRAFAILMMLQGHFIDTFLNSEFKDTTNNFFFVWDYLRGITAPTFFTISGLIFTYLLVKAKDKGDENKRLKRGVTRGLFIIFIGYLLRVPFLEWFVGNFNSYFLVVDVLQCIGLSLILIVILYTLCLKKNILFAIISFILGVSIFVTEPLYKNLNTANIPLLFSNYITKAQGSIFTIIPWFGYVALGAFLAVVFYKNLSKKNFKKITIVMFVFWGFVLIFYSSKFLVFLTNISKIEVFFYAANYNYLFIRLGNVLLYFAFFYALENYLKIPLILKIGQKTLTIYIIHFIIIYGSFIHSGLNKIIGATLTPFQVIFGAIMFLIIVCFISIYFMKTNTFIYKKLRLFLLK